MFTPVESLVGGLLIGGASTVALVLDGKIAGISGITGPCLRAVLMRKASEKKWNFLFTSGMIIGGLPALGICKDFSYPPVADFSAIRYILAGSLVGFGTRLGSGCTSGHGVCGLARLGVRSIAAVPTFMLSAGLTVAFTRHIIKVDPSGPTGMASLAWPPSGAMAVFASCSSLVLAASAIIIKQARSFLGPLVSGVIFSLGLSCAGMTSQYKVMDFLDVAGTWDPSLAFVMGGALMVTFPAYFWARKETSCPLNEGATFESPKSDKPDIKLVVGNIAFGVGWGLLGVCPGPSITGFIPHLTQGVTGIKFAAAVLCLWASWLATDRVLHRLQIRESLCSQKDKSL
eukprot:TRINITY_DN75905_c0_g1_i1.p1 TRINITY_DN75905_c0_g1~~TRINITY_DN75905_c0_g1_i1.p1  ORF type:complete len:344 (+),score=49.03 TRINITY_DN75905_c0_g1_i1:49-1080(+)